MEYMLFKKKKETPKDITLEWLIEVGVPPIFANIIMKRINELFMKNPSLNAFNPEDFRTIPIWPKDQKKLAETLNRALK